MFVLQEQVVSMASVMSVQSWALESVGESCTQGGHLVVAILIFHMTSS